MYDRLTSNVVSENPKLAAERNRAVYEVIENTW